MVIPGIACKCSASRGTRRRPFDGYNQQALPLMNDALEGLLQREDLTKLSKLVSLHNERY